MEDKYKSPFQRNFILAEIYHRDLILERVLHHFPEGEDYIDQKNGWGSILRKALGEEKFWSRRQKNFIGLIGLEISYLERDIEEKEKLTPPGQEIKLRIRRDAREAERYIELQGLLSREGTRKEILERMFPKRAQLITEDKISIMERAGQYRENQYYKQTEFEYTDPENLMCMGFY